MTCNVSSSEIGNLGDSFDNFYGNKACWQDFIDWSWQFFDFSKGHWDDGAGYDNPCDKRRPLMRTLSAIYALTYSKSESDGRNFLDWGYKHAGHNIDEFRLTCDISGAIAQMHDASGWEEFWGTDEDYVIVDKDFVYGEDVVERAGTLIHEARHYEKGHNANFPSWSALSGSGADSHWGYQGAWTWHALWLWWFYARAENTTPAAKQSAKQSANWIIDNCFAQHPGKQV